jgi:hypothetical protein
LKEAVVKARKYPAEMERYNKRRLPLSPELEIELLPCLRFIKTSKAPYRKEKAMITISFAGMAIVLF